MFLTIAAMLYGAEPKQMWLVETLELQQNHMAKIKLSIEISKGSGVIPPGETETREEDPKMFSRVACKAGETQTLEMQLNLKRPNEMTLFELLKLYEIQEKPFILERDSKGALLSISTCPKAKTQGTTRYVQKSTGNVHIYEPVSSYVCGEQPQPPCHN